MPLVSLASGEGIDSHSQVSPKDRLQRVLKGGHSLTVESQAAQDERETGLSLVECTEEECQSLFSGFDALSLYFPNHTSSGFVVFRHRPD